eukprot:PhF_6_TR17353/c0_g1_i1/m.26577
MDMLHTNAVQCQAGHRPCLHKTENNRRTPPTPNNLIEKPNVYPWYDGVSWHPHSVPQRTQLNNNTTTAVFNSYPWKFPNSCKVGTTLLLPDEAEPPTASLPPLSTLVKNGHQPNVLPSHIFEFAQSIKQPQDQHTGEEDKQHPTPHWYCSDEVPPYTRDPIHNPSVEGTVLSLLLSERSPKSQLRTENNSGESTALQKRKQVPYA